MNNLSVLRSLAATCVLVAATALSTARDAFAQKAVATKTADGFTITSRTLELTVSQGAVTRVFNRLTNEFHTTPSGVSSWMPRGLICSAPESGGMPTVSALHGQWGSYPI